MGQSLGSGRSGLEDSSMTPDRPSGDTAPSEPEDPEDREEHRRVSLIDTDVFGDEYALDHLDIQHGFVSPLGGHEDPFADYSRPTEAVSHPRSTLDGFDESPSIGPEDSPNDLKSDPEPADSTERDRVAIAGMPLQAQSISATSIACDNERNTHRRHSSSLAFSAARPSSPFRGATGPSHPYSMYPQGVGVFRSPSVATTSTYRVPDRTSYTTPRGPAHPYSMYPQNTLAEATIPGEMAPPSIPVGFLSLGQRYQPRVGTSGEDVQDIVGPDGHTEQLPAYSRYADATQTKEPPPSHVGGDIAGVPIPNEEQTPVPTAIENHTEPPRDQGLTPEAIHAVNLSAEESETSSSNETSKEKWVEKGRKRVCCGLMPLWAILVLVTMIILAAAIGGVIGGSVASSSGKRLAEHDVAIAITSAATPVTSTTSTATQIDASPLTNVPSNLPQLPCGTYAVTIRDPQESSNACLGDTAQAKAWDCTIPMGTLQLQVKQGQGHAINELRLLLNEEAENGPIMYGAQPPIISQPQQLSMFEDLEDHSLGPAWFFQQAYDKVVIVRQEDFLAGAILDQAPSNPFSVKGRSSPYINHSPAKGLYPRDRAGIAQPGEQPWYCFWNHTLLEGFIYVTQNVSAASSSTLLEPSTTSSSLSYKARKTSSPKPSTQPIPAYPKQVKVGELRTKPTAPDYIAPYCQQMQILNDGTVGVVINTATRGPNIVPLNETTPAYQKVKTSGSGSGGRRERRASKLPSTTRMANIERRNFYTDSCHCEWMDKLL